MKVFFRIMLDASMYEECMLCIQSLPLASAMLTLMPSSWFLDPLRFSCKPFRAYLRSGEAVPYDDFLCIDYIRELFPSDFYLLLLLSASKDFLCCSSMGKYLSTMCDKSLPEPISFSYSPNKFVQFCLFDSSYWIKCLRLGKTLTTCVKDGCTMKLMKPI